MTPEAEARARTGEKTAAAGINLSRAKQIEIVQLIQDASQDRSVYKLEFLGKYRDVLDKKSERLSRWKLTVDGISVIVTYDQKYHILTGFFCPKQHKTVQERRQINELAQLAQRVKIIPHVYERLAERGPHFGITPSPNPQKTEVLVRRLLSESKEVQLDPTRKMRRIINNKFEEARYFSVKKKNGADLRFVVVNKNGQQDVVKTIEVVVDR